MFTHKIPVNEQPTGKLIPLVPTAPADGHQHAPAACSCQHPAPAPAAARPTMQLTPGSLALLIGGGTVAVLVIGAVLVSMLLAVAITAGSLAIVALVVRSVLTNPGRKH
ncbi:SpdD-like protein [Streptomyces sp. NPDC048518]|uniref:SpdD-like protein n=1 Tax=Streptomyces sp. NPDC048518 TaxID=3155029 RepID=UPI0033F2D7F3